MSKPIADLRSPRFPEADPLGPNRCVVAGTLSGDPRPARSPLGSPVLLLPVEFPVLDPRRPHLLWTWASCEVEMPGPLASDDGVADLGRGTPVRVAGQLSERSTPDGAAMRGVVLATSLRSGSPLEAKR